MTAEIAAEALNRMRVENLGAVWVAGRWWFKTELREFVA